MIDRLLNFNLFQALQEMPAVCLLGPRQVGKTTLALKIAEKRQALYLDLESEQDLAKLAEAELYLQKHLDRLVILDEVHRKPGLFPVVRGLIDQARQQASSHGCYLLLGSASPELLKQSGESLAGRVRYLELMPFSVLEKVDKPVDELWLRGGFPGSLLTGDNAQSMRWRQDFIRTYLEHDIPQFGPRIAAETLRRFWLMLAYRHGGLLLVSDLARSLDVDAKTIVRYLDLMVDLFLVRRLPPWYENLGKRLVKSPRLYLRDSGILHALLSVSDMDVLLVHPLLGASWEGFVIENLLNVAPQGTNGYFYRTSGGAEIDLLLVFPNGERWAVDIKRSLKPKPERGFHEACADLHPSSKYVVYSGGQRYPLTSDIEVCPLTDLAKEVHDWNK